jgi:hypothetical protein
MISVPESLPQTRISSGHRPEPVLGPAEGRTLGRCDGRFFGVSVGSLSTNESSEWIRSLGSGLETDRLFFGCGLSGRCHHRFGDKAGIAAYRVLYRLADLGMLL